MCFHYSLAAGFKAIGTRFNADTKGINQFSPIIHINGFSHPKVPVIIAHETENKAIISTWGLIPEWISSEIKARKIQQSTLNARCETIFEKPSFKYAAKHHRCIVPATGYFEWKHFDKRKYPHYIFSKSNTIISFAGIYTEWGLNLGKKSFHTFSILTKPANALLSKVNNMSKRMPILISKCNEQTWLNAATEQHNITEIINYETNTDLDFYAINQKISNMDEQNISILEPFYYPELDNNLLF